MPREWCASFFAVVVCSSWQRIFFYSGRPQVVAVEANVASHERTSFGRRSTPKRAVRARTRDYCPQRLTWLWFKHDQLNSAALGAAQASSHSRVCDVRREGVNIFFFAFFPDALGVHGEGRAFFFLVHHHLVQKVLDCRIFPPVGQGRLRSPRWLTNSNLLLCSPKQAPGLSTHRYSAGRLLAGGWQVTHRCTNTAPRQSILAYTVASFHWAAPKEGHKTMNLLIQALFCNAQTTLDGLNRKGTRKGSAHAQNTPQRLLSAHPSSDDEYIRPPMFEGCPGKHHVSHSAVLPAHGSRATQR